MKTPSKTMANVKKHISSILFPILYTLLLFLVAVLIYFYANGYRIDILKQEITQTGVINIESNIYNAEIYLNGKLIGKTPKSTSLEVGNYDVIVKKDGYNNWEKNITIQEGKSSPITSFLVKQNPTFTTLWTSTGEIVKTWSNSADDHILFLTKESEKYKLWRYNVNPALLDFSGNPLEIMALDNDNITILLSPNGLQALLTITNTDNTISQYIIDTQHLNTLSTLKALDNSFTKSYTEYWSLDSNYLILDSSTNLLSYNIKQNLNTTLITKDSNTTAIWTTDSQGYLYIVETSEANDSMNTYKIKQVSLDGTENKYVIDGLYFNKSDKYIQQYRKNGFQYTEFTTSPESTMSAGEITSILVNQDAQGVFITTSLATYWYNIENQKFIMISAYPSTLIIFNPDEDNLIFKDDNHISVFTYNKVEGDPTTSIGSKIIGNILDKEKVSNLNWIYNSQYICYLEEGIIYTSGQEGDNKSYISKVDNLLEIAHKSLNNDIITLTKDEANKLSITSIKIY